MSTSPVPTTAPSQKRPLEEPSSPNGPTDQPDAKRPALDKVKDEEPDQEAAPASPSATDVKPEPETTAPAAVAADAGSNEGPADSHGDTVVLDAPPAGMPSATKVLETQPVQSTAANGASAGAQDQYSAQQQDESNWLHIRAI
ncbi:hypothetical protein KCU84_g25339, partial [Aureobasidium melanogenum]